MSRRIRRLAVLLLLLSEGGFLVLTAFAAHNSWRDVETSSSSWSWSGFIWALVFGLSITLFSDLNQARRNHFKELRRTRRER